MTAAKQPSQCPHCPKYLDRCPACGRSKQPSPSAFNAAARALNCCNSLDGYIETVFDENDEEGIPAEAVDIVQGYIQRAFEAGREAERADKRTELEAIRALLEDITDSESFVITVDDEAVDTAVPIGRVQRALEMAEKALGIE